MDVWPCLSVEYLEITGCTTELLLISAQPFLLMIVVEAARCIEYGCRGLNLEDGE